MDWTEKRRYRRWEVYLPCELEWGGRTFKGLIKNLSQGGALVTQVEEVPRVGHFVTIRFQVKQETVELTAELTSSVVHTSSEMKKLGQVGWLGVEFQGPSQEIEEKLVPFIQRLQAGQPD